MRKSKVRKSKVLRRKFGKSRRKTYNNSTKILGAVLGVGILSGGLYYAYNNLKTKSKTEFFSIENRLDKTPTMLSKLHDVGLTTDEIFGAIFVHEKIINGLKINRKTPQDTRTLVNKLNPILNEYGLKMKTSGFDIFKSFIIRTDLDETINVENVDFLHYPLEGYEKNSTTLMIYYIGKHTHKEYTCLSTINEDNSIIKESITKTNKYLEDNGITEKCRAEIYSYDSSNTININ